MSHPAAPSLGQHAQENRPPKRGIRVSLLTLYIYQSLGMRQIGSVLRAAGHEPLFVFLKEFRLGRFSGVTPREEELLLGVLRDLKPDLVGISLTSSFTADLAFHLADRIRESSGLPVVVGGPHASAAPEECLEHADFVCVGEGDEAIVDLADALSRGEPTAGIANLWSRVNGEIRRNDVRPLAQDLDAYPPIAYGEAESYYIEDERLRKVDPAALGDMYQTTASRMCCPFGCTFCAAVWLRRGLYAGKGKVCRYRSVDKVVEEIERARRVNPNIRLVRFWDEIFGVGAPRGWLDEFCERYTKKVGLPFEIWSHPAAITEDRIRKLRSAGLAAAWVGVESGSGKVRREVLNRRETDEVVLRAADILHRHGVEAGYEFILDIPWLAEENRRGTFELIMRLPRPFQVHLHSLSLLPRTVLAERAVSEGLIKREQIGLRDRPLVDRFASHFWQHHLEIRSRRAAFWHSLIYLAGMPSVPRSLLWMAYRLRSLLLLCPRALMLAAEIAGARNAAGETKYFPPLARVYPGVAGYLSRHPALARASNWLVRRLVRLARRVFA